MRRILPLRLAQAPPLGLDEIGLSHLRTCPNTVWLAPAQNGHVYLISASGANSTTSFMSTSSVVSQDQQRAYLPLPSGQKSAYSLSRILLAISAITLPIAQIAILDPPSTSKCMACTTTDTRRNLFFLA